MFNVLKFQESFFRELNNRINSVTSYIQEVIKESTFLDVESFNSIVKNYDFLSKNLWCCNCIGIFFKDEVDVFGDLDLKVPNYFEKFDFNKFSSDTVLSRLFLEFGCFIEEDVIDNFFDKEKLKLGLKYFSSGDYYTTVGLFLKIIDSLSIKKLLKNEELGVRHNDDEIKTTLRVSVNAICDILLNNSVIEFSDKFEYSKFCLKDDNFTLSKEKSIIKLGCNDGYTSYFNEDIRYLFVSYSLLKTLSILYALAPWDKGKPRLFNRHWYEHGMYDVEDVSKEDCIKVMFICFHMLMLYSVLDK